MLFHAAVVIVSLGVLIVAADWFVRSASSLAARLGAPPVAVGLTIVAFGTSAPELMVGVNAALQDAPGIAIGNIVGSNVANVLLVLGVGAAIRPIGAKEPGLARDTAIMFAATAAFVFIAYAVGGIGPWFGALFLAALALFLWNIGREFRAGRPDALADDLFSAQEGAHSWPWIIAGLTVGLLGLIMSPRFLVPSAVELATALNVRDEVIALTVIAVGTSLPELTTVIVAAARREAALALGGIVGSNI
ncbi:MAG: sodium:calcium antiporter, partial [Caulobacterales bacterium]|nr:sodium:calcium antiporter [Caulobacterales bacterium]